MLVLSITLFNRDNYPIIGTIKEKLKIIDFNKIVRSYLLLFYIIKFTSYNIILGIL